MLVVSKSKYKFCEHSETTVTKNISETVEIERWLTKGLTLILYVGKMTVWQIIVALYA